MYKWLKANIDYLGAGIAGLLYFFCVFGWKMLNPFDSDWILAYGQDCGRHVINWFFYMNSDFSWPLTMFNGASYPYMQSATYGAIMPFYAVPFKCLWWILPQGFHYFGIVILLNLVLQGICAVYLLRQLKCRGIIKFAGVLVILFSPVLLFRIPNHISLSGHWPILLALAFWIREKPVRLVWYQALLLAALFIHPYIWIMVGILFCSDFLKRLVRNPGDSPDEKKKQQLEYVKKMLISGAVCLVGLYLSGYFSADYINTTRQHESYSLNLNSLVNPCFSYVSGLIKPMPMASSYESFNYLGAGVLLAIVMLFPFIISRITREAWWIRHCEIILTCTVFIVIAINFNVFLGSIKLIQLTLPETVTNLLSVIRASGRFCWPVWYLIIAGILVLASKLKQRHYACVVMILMVALQMYDLGCGLVRSKYVEAQYITSRRLEPVSGEFIQDVQQGGKHIFYGFVLSGKYVGNGSYFRYLALNGYTINNYYFARDNRECLEFFRKYLPEFEAGKYPEGWNYIKFRH